MDSNNWSERLSEADKELLQNLSDEQRAYITEYMLHKDKSDKYSAMKAKEDRKAFEAYFHLSNLAPHYYTSWIIDLLLYGEVQPTYDRT